MTAAVASWGHRHCSAASVAALQLSRQKHIVCLRRAVLQADQRRGGAPGRRHVHLCAAQRHPVVQGKAETRGGWGPGGLGGQAGRRDGCKGWQPQGEHRPFIPLSLSAHPWSPPPTRSLPLVPFSLPQVTEKYSLDGRAARFKRRDLRRGLPASQPACLVAGRGCWAFLCALYMFVFLHVGRSCGCVCSRCCCHCCRRRPLTAAASPSSIAWLGMRSVLKERICGSWKALPCHMLVWLRSLTCCMHSLPPRPGRHARGARGAQPHNWRLAAAYRVGGSAGGPRLRPLLLGGERCARLDETSVRQCLKGSCGAGGHLWVPGCLPCPAWLLLHPYWPRRRNSGRRQRCAADQRTLRPCPLLLQMCCTWIQR